MLFHSWQFAVFGVVVYLVYLLLSRSRFSLHWLLLASLVFYGFAGPTFVLLLLYAAALNFAAAVMMERGARKKLWLAVAIVGTLAPLVFFKYSRFAVESLNAVLPHARIAVPSVLLPAGLSFFTFRVLGYTIDCYRGGIEREKSFLRFATFASFFPTLLAGPIERASHFLRQVTGGPRRPTANDLAEGMSLFVVGLFKKVALADYLSLYVGKVYSSPGSFDGLTLAAATFAFAWQIYFDFSGYTDMARGVAKALGFDIMLNFRHPYLATGLGDFWNRWHISLSSWFKDYLYIPLGGNRKGTFGTYRNMLLTMVISGLWHGAAWTFVIWGFLHALGRFATRELERTSFYRQRVPTFLKQMLVFAFVCFCWIFFKASSLSDALLIVRRIFTAGIGDPRFPVAMLAMCLVIWAYQFLVESRLKWVAEWAPARVAAVGYMVLHLLLVSGGSSQPFVYLQF
ncbi:MAG: MBOAT family O-acyltransferase [Armatimonadota bacterium]|jgi:D-alanyl-lipoteichoic acid acyltransferase DltB (MBOAT superfamily)